MLDQLKRLVLAGSLVMAASTTAIAQENDAPREMASGAQGVIDSQIRAFRSRDHDQAFSYAAPNMQKMFGSTERFIGMVKNGYGAIYGAQGWSFGRSRMQAGTLVQEVLITGPQGRQWTAIYMMRQEGDGSWHIHGVQMRQGPGQST